VSNRKQLSFMVCSYNVHLNVEGQSLLVSNVYDTFFHGSPLLSPKQFQFNLQFCDSFQSPGATKRFGAIYLSCFQK